MFHTSSSRSRLSATYQISLLLFCCLSVLYFSQIVIKECIDLQILQLSNEEQKLGEECLLASTDHSSCLKTTVKKPDQSTVDR